LQWETAIFMEKYVLRFFIGGFAVSGFAAMGDVLRPRSFAGLFAAAPSVALGTLAIAISTKSGLYAALEGRSMILGAGAMWCYSITVRELMRRRELSAVTATMVSMPVWLVAAFGLKSLIMG
jgi:Protein of unknown function (DUF3147)